MNSLSNNISIILKITIPDEVYLKDMHKGICTVMDLVPKETYIELNETNGIRMDFFRDFPPETVIQVHFASVSHLVKGNTKNE